MARSRAGSALTCLDFDEDGLRLRLVEDFILVPLYICQPLILTPSSYTHLWRILSLFYCHRNGIVIIIVP